MPASSISAVGRMPPLVTAFWILKKVKAMPKITVQSVDDAEGLGAELAEAEGEVATEDADDALAGLGHVALGGDVPAGAVGAVGEDADAEDAEGAADAVDGDGADRVVDAAPLDEADREDHDARRRARR